jgi:outer membrane protein TolC
MSRRTWAAVWLAALAAGCSSYANYYERSADREVSAILSSKQPEAVDRWQENARFPKPEPPPEAPEPARMETPESEESEPRVLSLADAVRTAFGNNRSFKTEAETLYLAALSASLERRNYGPILTNTIEYVYSNGPGTDADGALAASLGVSKIVPSGGTVSAETTGSVDDNYEGGASSTYSHDVTLSFEQPLLKGFGYEAAYEDLTQAERDVIYALRTFELFRQDFAIDVLARYYRILRQKSVVENSRSTLERFTFLRKRSDALFNIGRVTAIDKFRAAQEELVASNELIAEQETLEALLDDFKVFLGLPTETNLDIEDVTPEMKQANIDLKSAIEAALVNRLDLKTDKDQLEDAERKVRVARNGLLPDLDLSASVTVAGSKTGGDPEPYAGSHSVGLALSLPLDKVPDRNTYKRALITRNRRRRTLELARDNVKVEVLNSYRRLRRLANSVRIQRANVTLAEKRVQNAQLRFFAGTLGNRDVVEAQSAKLRAQNALIGAILDYEIARLQLKRDIGIFFLHKDGLWKE